MYFVHKSTIQSDYELVIRTVSLITEDILLGLLKIKKKPSESTKCVLCAQKHHHSYLEELAPKCSGSGRLFHIHQLTFVSNDF